MSFDFTTLVTDRTQSDLQRVRSVAAKIINGTASEAEIAEWNAATMKGAYNYTDLNRVTAAMDELRARLNGYGYTVPGYRRIEISHAEAKPSGRLPDGHTELEWIESTGTQHIDTGFKTNNNARVVMDAELVSTTGAVALFGARTAATQNNFALIWNATFFRSDYNNSYAQEWSVSSSGRRIFDKNKETTTIDGVSQSYENSAFQTPHNMLIFASSNNGTPFQYSALKVYSCQIYDNDTLVRDYVPDLTDDGQVGLYDLVEGKFYPNAGTGAFIAGPVVEQTPATGGDDKDPYLWYETDIPTPELMAAYLANVSAIRSVLDMLPTTPAAPADMERLTTDKANAIERILADINTLIHNMIAAWLYSGEIYSGEV